MKRDRLRPAVQIGHDRLAGLSPLVRRAPEQPARHLKGDPDLLQRRPSCAVHDLVVRRDAGDRLARRRLRPRALG